jgi:hypothetical protein
MLIKYSRPLLMCLLLAFTATPTILAQTTHSAAYKKCRKACRASYEKTQSECKRKPASERQTCETAAKEAARKCKRGCTE